MRGGGRGTLYGAYRRGVLYNATIAHPDPSQPRVIDSLLVAPAARS